MVDELEDSRCQIADGYNLGRKPVRVIVGDEEEEFYVHESLLSRSKFFEKALKGEWNQNQEKQNKEKVIYLPDDESRTFKAYLHWIYTGCIPCQNVADSDASENCHLELAKLYVLAEKLLDDEFQDRVLDALVVTCREPRGSCGAIFPGPRTIKAIYEYTPESSPARKLMVDMYVAHATKSWSIDAEYGSAFTLDLANALLRDRPSILAETWKRKYLEIDSGSPCSYHKHEKDKPCTTDLA